MDWQSWLAQRTPRTEIQRSGPGHWPVGAPAFPGDPLGPIMHIHDGATEIFYFVSGRCRMEVGHAVQIFQAGDFVLVPPEVPHNLWQEGDEDLRMLFIVAPNLVNNMWRTDNFPPGAMERTVRRARLAPAVDLPSDENIRTRLMALGRGQTVQQRTLVQQEAIIYVLEGTIDLTAGNLGGRLTPHRLVHVTTESEYTFTPADEQALVVVFTMQGR